MERSLMLAQKYEHLSRHQAQDDSHWVDVKPSNLTQLPTAKVKSGALESLLAQNEDLAARLKVLLRRLAAIEEENLLLTQEHREMKHQLTGLKDQISVYREKESTWRDRTVMAEETLDIQQAELRQKEMEFAKLRTQEWEAREALQDQLIRVERSYHRLLRYRSRIQSWVSPTLKNLSHRLGEKDHRIDQLRREIQNTEIQCQNLIHKNLEQLRKSREAYRASEEQKIQMISQFEQQREDLQSEIKTLHETSSELRRKAAQLDRSLERQDYLENRLVVAERENQELRTKFNEEFSQTYEQMVDWRNKAQAFEVERDSLSQQKVDLEQQLRRTKEVAERLDEQMGTLRLMWKEKVHENEKLRQSNEALEALNAELSIRVNERLNSDLNPNLNSSIK